MINNAPENTCVLDCECVDCQLDEAIDQLDTAKRELIRLKKAGIVIDSEVLIELSIEDD